MKTVCIKTNGDIINVKMSFKKDDDSFYYAPNFIRKNKDRIIKELNLRNAKKVIFEDEESFIISHDLFILKKVSFNYNDSLSSKVLNELLKQDDLKEVTCYFMPSNYVHQFSNKNVSIYFNNKLSFTLDFTKYNKLNKLKEMYYKEEITFFNSLEIKNNLEDFLSVNKYLKVINLYCYNKEILTFIINTLNQKNKKKIKILIHISENNNYLESKEQKEIEKIKTDAKIKFVYDNLSLKSLSFNTLKIDCAIVVLIAIFFIYSNTYQNYTEAKVVNDIKNEIVTEEIKIDYSPIIIEEDHSEIIREEEQNIEESVCINHKTGTLTIEEKNSYLDKVKIKYPNISDERLELISNALDAVGLPYYWGGGHKTLENMIEIAQDKWGEEYCSSTRLCGLDCSGFVRWIIYSVTEVDIMEGGSGINFNNPIFRNIRKKEMIPGDVAMNHSYLMADGTTHTGHVGIFLYEEDGQYYYINAYNPERGVVISLFNRFNLFYSVDIENNI